jgi:N-acetylglucosamine kinase-like BadF-type ATPase
LPYQYEELKKRVEAIGFSRYGLANDGILGIKGASENGIGICAVNGTGTVVIGINRNGEILQVGGVGENSGDSAGGSHVRTMVIAALYSFYYRCGDDSIMFPRIMKLLDAKPEDLLSVICDYSLMQNNSTDIIRICAEAAEEGDGTAKKIFNDMGISIGKSVAGCIKKLRFENEKSINIVQVGSIWHKTPHNISEIFLKTSEEFSGRKCRIVKFETTAAAGGILWAKEILDGVIPNAKFRAKVIGNTL